eukprot:1161966-Pelagomonas_calceolata.AAC.9
MLEHIKGGEGGTCQEWNVFSVSRVELVKGISRPGTCQGLQGWNVPRVADGCDPHAGGVGAWGQWEGVGLLIRTGASLQFTKGLSHADNDI